MKKEKQIGIRVGVPAFFALELEDVYQHTEGARRTLAFPDFVGLLVGLGLEQYRKVNAPRPETTQEKAPENNEELPEDEPLHLFDMDPRDLHDLFNDFDEAMEQADATEHERRLHLAHMEDLA